MPRQDATGVGMAWPGPVWLMDFPTAAVSCGAARLPLNRPSSPLSTRYRATHLDQRPPVAALVAAQRSTVSGLVVSTIGWAD